MAHAVSGRALPRVTSLAVVAIVHILAIGAFVVALHPKIVISEPPGDIHARMIDVFNPRPAPPPSDPTMHPVKTVDVPVPNLPQDTPAEHDTPVAPGPGPQSAVPAAGDPFVAARAILATHSIPDYPPMAVRLNETGNVLLVLSIDETGTVVNASVVRSSGHDDLDEAAIAWVKAHWRYAPATRGGVAVASSANALVTFRLTGR
jgi:protein TonB